jgi:hypothetical protein
LAGAEVEEELLPCQLAALIEQLQQTQEQLEGGVVETEG